MISESEIEELREIGQIDPDFVRSYVSAYDQPKILKEEKMEL